MSHKTGWVVYRRNDIPRNQKFIDMLQVACSNREIALKVIPYEEIQFHLSKDQQVFANYEYQAPDFVINRSVSPWLNEVTELTGIRCFNSAYVARVANDKRLAHAVFANIGMPMLPSKAVHRESLTKEVSTDSNLESFILKDPIGRGGTGVELIDPEKGIEHVGGSLPADLLHQPVGGVKGKDLRIYIINNKIVGAVLRESATDFRANISYGGNSSLYELNNKERGLIKLVTNSIHLDFVGLDFLIDEQGELLFNEMEDAVGCRSLYMNSSINIADLFADYIYNEITC
ncbi:hypothetical protein K8O68_13775 [Salipaludibacillus sp. CUR1]|uniref:ATP-grasp domain-containing protein n=1 Tax=Salipaludibacillus sp. CUR1 TaxID=2820003 RepID=UPI001E2B100A|nr:hypothetical protein [Salipaludibacillus sp. CUR1]MCE7793490.1 hypothetical protein [Salipaludibacillus sp. CUR1]